MTNFAKYEILEEIGRGGFAIVYKARDVKLDRIVALKVLDLHRSSDPGFATRFEREARASAGLQHPHIVTIYDAGEAEGQLYIAMEYLPGRTLQQLLEDEGALPVERALLILEQLAGAMDYAHGQGIVHRDVKPSNVMVGEDETGLQVTLMDFGLVKALEGSTALTSLGTLLGTPHYMAPEQGDPERAAEVGPPADRYALGIIAYHALTGRVPFPGHSPAATLYAHEHKPVPPPRDLRPDLSPALAEALLKMLSKAPGDRFDSSRAFVAHMRQTKQETRRPPRPAREPLRLPGWVWVVGALVLLAGVLFLLPQLGGKDKESITRASPTITPSPTDTATPEPSAILHPTDTATPEPTDTVTPEPTDTVTPEPSATLRPTDTATPEPSATTEPTDTVTSEPSDTATPMLGVGSVTIRETDGMTMVYVPGGTFLMGSDNDDVDYAMQLCSEIRDGCERSSFEDEQPLHSVTLDSFWIDRTEVSNAQYALCVDTGRCQAPKTCDWEGEPTYEDASKADHPVVCADWNGAQSYCEWAGARLPTEAEWEYAARGPQGNVYPWGDTFDGTRLNFCDANCTYDWKDTDYDDGYERTSPVGSFENGASWCQALNMAGNVLEWVGDWYDDYPADAQTNPAGAETGDYRVVRGGARNLLAYYARSANRFGRLPHDRDLDWGFRCVGASTSVSP